MSITHLVSKMFMVGYMTYLACVCFYHTSILLIPKPICKPETVKISTQIIARLYTYVWKYPCMFAIYVGKYTIYQKECTGKTQILPSRPILRLMLTTKLRFD